MKVRDFLEAVYSALNSVLPTRYHRHSSRIRFGYLQIFFESPAIHYEVWVQRRVSRIELGLHFEGERETNYRWAGLLGGRALELQSALGPQIELEEWTETWTRLHETIEFKGPLTEELARTTASALARYIEVLEPILEEERAAV